MAWKKKSAALWRLARPFTCLPPALGVLAGSAAALGAQAHREGLSLSEVLSRLDAGAGPGAAPLAWTRSVGLGVLAAVALNIYSNALNQLCDIEIDRQAKPERPLVRGTLSRGTSLSVALAGLLAGLTWALWARPPGVDSPEFFFCALLAALLTSAYSVPPLRLKRWGLAANLAIALARGLLLKVAGWVCLYRAFRPFDAEPWALGGVFFVFTLGAVSTKDFSDAPHDAAFGVRSLPVAWGFKRAAWFSALCLSLPWLALPLLGWGGLLSAPRGALLLLGGVLALYGAWTGYLLVRSPEALGRERNHPAWTNMYVLMMAAQVGLAVVYLL